MNHFNTFDYQSVIYSIGHVAHVPTAVSAVLYSAVDGYGKCFRVEQRRKHVICFLKNMSFSAYSGM